MWWIDPKKLKTIEAKRICVIKPSALGDVVQALPVLRAIRARFADAGISWVISKPLAPLLEGHPNLQESILFERRGSFSAHLSLARSLRMKKFDLVFDLQGLMRSGIMTTATQARYRVGLQTAREGSKLTCNLVIPSTHKDVPAGERYWRVAEALGVDVEQNADIEIGFENRLWVNQQLAGLRGPIVVINPGARWETKRWPIEGFANTALAAGSNFGCSVVIVGDRSDRKLCWRLETILRGSSQFAKGNIRNLCGMTDLKQLAGVLEQADTVLTNDSGPMHLAHAMGSRVVGIFLCTSAVRSGPPGEQHQLVSTQVACAASYKKHCPKSGLKKMCCMNELGVSRVWNALRHQLSVVERRAA